MCCEPNDTNPNCCDSSQKCCLRDTEFTNPLCRKKCEIGQTWRDNELCPCDPLIDCCPGDHRCTNKLCPKLDDGICCSWETYRSNPLDCKKHCDSCTDCCVEKGDTYLNNKNCEPICNPTEKCCGPSIPENPLCCDRNVQCCKPQTYKDNKLCICDPDKECCEPENNDAWRRNPNCKCDPKIFCCNLPGSTIFKQTWKENIEACLCDSSKECCVWP